MQVIKDLTLNYDLTVATLVKLYLLFNSMRSWLSRGLEQKGRIPLDLLPKLLLGRSKLGIYFEVFLKKLNSVKLKNLNFFSICLNFTLHRVRMLFPFR